VSAATTDTDADADANHPAWQPAPLRWQVWRSPSDQPAWARPALLLVTALAALAYSWHVGSTIEIFYAAAVRSMSGSWHNFIFGAFDPAGTITVDKLPGSLWVQALSVRIFGFHVWAIMLPQAIEGALTVLVLYRAVRRLAGPVAGLVAGVVLVASPATTTLDRGNIPDSLMILLLVLAADSTVTAILSGRWRSIVMTGVWVGLAFQAKMLEAWLVLPALGVAFLLAGRGNLVVRVARPAVMGAVAVVLSLSFMTFVALTPASQRPYVDGSTDNSIYQQVFTYNGYSRVGQKSPNEILAHTLQSSVLAQKAPPPVWNRLLTHIYGRDTGWLLPAALLTLLAILWQRRRSGRFDPWRAGALLWGLWLLTLCVIFSISTTMNAYYAGALSPAVAGLLGIGAALAWERRNEASTLAAAVLIVVVTVVYAAWLLPGRQGFPSWIAQATVALGAATVVALGWVVRRSRGSSTPGRVGIIGLGLGAAAVLFVPAVGSGSVVAGGLGPFDTPFQPSAVTNFNRQVFGPQSNPDGLAKIESVRRGAPDLMAAQTSAVAAIFIFATGQEVLPLGGYTGTIPSPTANAISSMIAAGRFHLALIASPDATAGARYIATHCLHVAPAASAVARLTLYYCQ
jgi:4-amino-4-deoxy-L-arabinose transferase-like glycosyltransferase